jgi:hypothetical protein
LKHNEENGIGVGLSTADALSRALGGDLKIKSVSTNDNHQTEAKFCIVTTS